MHGCPLSVFLSSTKASFSTVQFTISTTNLFLEEPSRSLEHPLSLPTLRAPSVALYFLYLKSVPSHFSGDLNYSSRTHYAILHRLYIPTPQVITSYIPSYSPCSNRLPSSPPSPYASRHSFQPRCARYLQSLNVNLPMHPTLSTSRISLLS